MNQYTYGCFGKLWLHYVAVERLLYIQHFSIQGEEVIPKEDAGQARTRTKMSKEVLEMSEEDECWSEKKVVCDLEVYDKDGNINTGEEAMKTWREHFAKVLGASNEGAVGDEERIGKGADINNCDTNRLGFSERLCQPIFREEVAWALEKVNKDAAPGKDGVTVDMMSAEVLFNVWFALLEVC